MKWRMDVIQLKQDEGENIGEGLPASRVALQDYVAIAQNARNLRSMGHNRDN